MDHKTLLLGLTFFLLACGTSNRKVIPPNLATNEVLTWHYICENTYGLDVEYANMGGDYTATIYNEDIAKRVLPKVGEWQFADQDWQWSQQAETTFKLIHHDKVIAQDCRSYSEVDDSGIVLLR